MLYKYVKSPPIRINYTHPKRHQYARSRKIFPLMVTILCITTGMGTIMFSTFPYVQATLQPAREQEVSKYVLKSHSESTPFVAGADYQLSNVYAANFAQNLAITNKSLNIDPKTHPELAHINGEMKLNISKIGLKKSPVVINVDSYNEKVYLPILTSKFAHFKGTSLPDHPGNVFIYGHSANELWARVNPTSPGVAFTYLNKLDIGDEISLEYNGKEYKYSVEKTKMVTPEDISPIFSYGDKKTLTLMTCWPPGVGTDRLIVIASQMD